MTLLDVSHLKKYFSSRQWWKLRSKPTITKAVDDISFEIGEGEIVGLLGPNGAGKTTTAHILLGVLTPTAGKIVYFGKDFFAHRSEILKQINFSSAYIRLPWRLTVLENLDVYGRLYEIPNRAKRIEMLLKEFDVWDLRSKAMSQLSSGETTRVLLTKAFLNYPRLLVLDEPTASLDPEMAVRVRQFLVKQQKEYNVSMLFTSHNMHEVQSMCNRIVFLNHGKIIAHDTPMKLVAQMERVRLRMRINQGKDTVSQYCETHEIVLSWEKERATLELNEEIISKVLYQLSDNGVRYCEIEILRPTLEDFFLETVHGEDA